MRIFLGCLVAVLALLQYRLWLSDEGMREVWHLSAAVESQRADNAVLVERNGQLRAEVANLKKGLTALEERARNDLGMIGVNETFYQVVDTPQLAPDDRQIEQSTIQASATP